MRDRCGGEDWTELCERVKDLAAKRDIKWTYSHEIGEALLKAQRYQ